MKKNKFLLVFLVVIMFTVMLPIATYAIAGLPINPNDEAVPGEFKLSARKILGAIRTVGSLIAVGTVLALGIKYMLGSAEEKAVNKKSMMPFLIGAILFFAAVNLTALIFDWANKAF